MIDLSEYEVVRQEYGTGTEPQLTLARGRIYINGYGLAMFPEHDYMQILVDKNSKCVAIKPLKTKVKDSFKWCTSGKKRKPRQMKCIPVYYLMYRMMGWDLNARYRITGELEKSGDSPILMFRLMDAICYVREVELDETGRPIVKEYFPKHWENNFGVPQMEYENRHDIDVFDDLAVFNVELDINKYSKKRMEDLKEIKESEKGETDCVDE